MTSIAQHPLESVEGFRLSPQQRRLWQMMQRHPGTAFASQIQVVIRGALNIDRLESAVRIVQKTHEILRTRFVCLPAARVPVQVITDNITGLDHTLCLSFPDAANADLEIESVAERLWKRAGTAEAVSGLNFTLIHVNGSEHVLLITGSALCSDAHALHAIARQVRDAYADGPSSPNEPIQYADISEWQNQLIESEAKNHDSYWKSADFSQLRFPALPFELRNPVSAEVNLGGFCHDVGINIAAGLQSLDLPRERAVEAFLVSAYQVLIGRLSATSRFLLGVTVDGRTPAELRDAVGLFAKSMPIPAVVDPQQRFVDLVRNVSTAIEFATYDQAFFDAESFALPQSRSAVPFTFTTCHAVTLEHTGSTQWQIKSTAECLEALDLSIAALIADGELKSLKFAWNQSIFREAEIRLLDGFYTNILRQVVRNPEQLLSEPSLDPSVLPLPATADASGEMSPCGIHEWIEEQCARVPQNVAVVCGDEQLTYAQLNERACRLAHHLRAAGAVADSVVAILAQRSTHFIVAIVAVLKAGAAWLPIDPDTPIERIKYMLRCSAAKILISEAELSSSLRDIDIPMLRMDALNAADTDLNVPRARVLPEQLAYVIFTSGSTGRPKGVAVEHRQLIAYLRGFKAELNLPDEASYVLVSTMAADLGHTPIFAALTSGGCVHVIPPAQLNDVLSLTAYFVKHPVDCIKIVPAHLEALCRSFPPHATFAWRTLVAGGEPLTWELIQFVKKLAPGCTIVNEYGPTETTVGVISASAELDKESFNTVEVPIGHPRAGVSAYVVDSSCRPVPAWVTGDLYIGGNHVGRGYIGASDLSAERFLPDPFQSCPGARMYVTGDRARYRSDGTLEFLGRRDGQIKLRGYRIELSEIEATLCRHAQVQAAIVMPMPDKNGGKLLAAWVAVGDAKVFPQELRRFASESLPSYMVPNVFTCVDRFKLTSNGKIDRQHLPPVAEDISGKAGTPVDQMEDSLLTVWRKVLGKETVNVDDNYFALGGDSLRVVQVVHEARRYGIAIRAMDILRHQTIRNLRKALHQEQRYELFPNGVPEASLPEPQEISCLPSDVVDFYPISEIQSFVLQKYAENQGTDGIYHIQECFHLEDPGFSRQALEAAFQAVVERHPVLRTVFYFQSSPPLQCVRRALPWKVATEDVSHLDGSAQEDYIAQQIQADRANLFDPANIEAPLFRIVVFLRSATQFSVLFSCHHAIMDGWGHQIFLNHLLEAYTNIKSSSTPELGTPDHTYHEFVNFEHALGRSEQVAQFWRSYLSGTDFPPLPDFILPAVEEQKDPIIVSELEPQQNEALEHIAREHAVSMQALFLASWLQVLRQWSGEPAVTTGVISNGRSEYLADPLSAVGLFWNVAPVVSRKQLPLLQHAEAVQKDLVDIQPYASYPLTKLIAENGGQDLFYSAFRYLNFWNSRQIPEESGLRFLGAYGVDRYPFALTCTAVVGPSGRCIQLEYNPKSISLESVRNLLKSYRNLLDEVAQLTAPGECS
jgi:amino acid adenylation domain-containing protein